MVGFSIFFIGIFIAFSLGEDTPMNIIAIEEPNFYKRLA